MRVRNACQLFFVMRLNCMPIVSPQCIIFLAIVAMATADLSYFDYLDVMNLQADGAILHKPPYAAPFFGGSPSTPNFDVAAVNYEFSYAIATCSDTMCKFE